MTELDPSTAQAINTGGGAYIENSTINTGGGHFVGRDQHIHHHYHPPMLGKPFQAPPLPAHFIPRPEVTDALKARLLADGPTAPGILVVSAIHGLGGIGKSTLAAALAYDEEVQQYFKDGILWATLGQQPELLPMLSAWIQALGNYDFRPTTVKAATIHLRTLLQDKAALLVVDDVWDSDHAKPFQVGSSKCQVLITTRRADVAEEVGAKLYQMDVMTPEQALVLLAVRLGRPLEETEQVEALVLAKDVGYLPLALELATARVARGITWTTLHEVFETEIARLEELEGPRRHGKRPRLEASLNLSLNDLRREDEAAWKAFVWLGVLPEDVRIAAPMGGTLWGVDKAEAIRILELLWNEALLLPAPPILVGEHQWSAYRLHDLMHDIARRQLIAVPPQGLGLDLPVAQAALLERYHQCTEKGLWHTLPDDSYIHAHLTWHMEQAGHAEQIHDLLWEETTESKNGWYESRDHLGQVAGYLEDVIHAWKIATYSNKLSLQIRYAFIESTLHSLAQLPLELLVPIVQYKSKLMSPNLVLDRVRQMPLIWQRADALHDLAPHLPEQVLPEALRMALAIAQENERGVLGLAPFLPPDLLEDTLCSLPYAVREEIQTWFLEIVIPIMPSRFLDLALKTARQIRKPHCRALALSYLTTHLSDDLLYQVILEALSAIAQGSYPPFHAKALMNLAQYITPKQIEEAWEAPLEREDNLYIDVQSYIWLAQAFLRSGAIDQVFLLLKQISWYEDQYEAILKIAPELLENFLFDMLNYLPGDQRRFTEPMAMGILAKYTSTDLQYRILDLIRGMEDNECRLVGLTLIAPHLGQPEIQNQVWKEVATILHQFGRYWDSWNLNTYKEIVKYLPTDLILQVLQESQKTGDWYLVSLASFAKLADPLKRTVCAKFLAKARQGKIDLSELIELAPCFSPMEREELFKIALSQAQYIGDQNAFDALAPFKALISNVWEERGRHTYFHEEDHIRVLLTIVPYSSQPRKMAGLALGALNSRGRDNFKYYLQQLVPLLPFFEADQQAILTEQILRTITLSLLKGDFLPYDTDINYVLHMLLIHTFGESNKQIVDHILSLARDAQVHSDRVFLLSIVLSYLSEADLQDALTEITDWLKEDTKRSKSYFERSDSFNIHHFSTNLLKLVLWARVSTLIPLPENNELDRALASFSVNQDTDNIELASALVEIGFCLPHSSARPIFERAVDFVSGGIKSRRTLDHTLLAYLPDDLKARVLLESLRYLATIDEYKLRPKLLISLAAFWAQLPTEEAYRILQEILPLFARGDRKQFLWDLHAIAPVILALGGEKSIETIVEETYQVITWWP